MAWFSSNVQKFHILAFYARTKWLQHSQSSTERFFFKLLNYEIRCTSSCIRVKVPVQTTGRTPLLLRSYYRERSEVVLRNGDVMCTSLMWVQHRGHSCASRLFVLGSVVLCLGGTVCLLVFMIYISNDLPPRWLG